MLLAHLKKVTKSVSPVSLPQVCGKVFEQLLYNDMFSFFSENDLMSKNNLDLDQMILVPTSYYQ